MNKMKVKAMPRYGVLFGLIVLLLVTGSVLSQISNSLRLKKAVIDQGGARSQSTHFIMVDALGQTGPIGEAAGAHFTISSGFLMKDFNPPLVVDPPVESEIPGSFELCQNYPNPFNPATTIEYHLPYTSQVILTIYDIKGQVVYNLTDETKQAGRHTTHWDGHSESGQMVASGTYFYRIEIIPQQSGHKSYAATRRMMLLK